MHKDTRVQKQLMSGLQGNSLPAVQAALKAGADPLLSPLDLGMAYIGSPDYIFYTLRTLPDPLPYLRAFQAAGKLGDIDRFASPTQHETLLHVALSTRQEATAIWLLQQGANRYIQCDKKNAEDYARALGLHQVLTWLLPKDTAFLPTGGVQSGRRVLSQQPGALRARLAPASETLCMKGDLPAGVDPNAGKATFLNPLK